MDAPIGAATVECRMDAQLDGGEIELRLIGRPMRDMTGQIHVFQIKAFDHAGRDRFNDLDRLTRDAVKRRLVHRFISESGKREAVG